MSSLRICSKTIPILFVKVKYCKLILSNIIYCSFPFKRPDILELWIKAVSSENWTPTKSSKLCGEHFLPTDDSGIPGTARFLKADAVPSIFSFPQHLLPKNADSPRKIKKLIGCICGRS
ncbi:unnamed protein product [Phaedon cochleariae]|uniref:THAP-type domain-containing protein n=1 Tax=Phaedon cochleariae TaxID=80249 RepID=A0A9N9SJT3_PHACE|nr:unnamed protein product [Phaedon cochleariae]